MEKIAKKLRILLGELEIEGEINNSKTAQLILEALPIETETSLWGEEIYFAIPVKAELDSGAREVVLMGDLGYWPTGRAFCIFFGPTPASRGDEIRAASAVNLIGKIVSDPKLLKKVKEGVRVRLEKA